MTILSIGGSLLSMLLCGIGCAISYAFCMMFKGDTIECRSMAGACAQYYAEYYTLKINYNKNFYYRRNNYTNRMH